LNIGLEDAAKHADITSDELKAVEEGTEYLSLTQLRKLAKYYKRPFALFYLKNPPELPKNPKDYRTKSGLLSKDILLSIRRARKVQTYIKEFSDDYAKPKFWEQRHSPTGAGELAREWLGITHDEQVDSKSPSDFLKLVGSKLLDKNIHLLQHSFPAEDAKAYCIADEPQVIVVSTNDKSMGSRIFSVFHELGHLADGQSGICSINMDAQIDRERFCDRFAAEMLMPKELVKSLASNLSGELLIKDENLDSIAKGVKSSKTALLIRFVELGLITEPQRRKKQHELSLRSFPQSSGRSTRTSTVVKENGTLLPGLVIHEYLNGTIPAADTARILNMNQAYIEEVGSRLGFE
jgi:Zn-dependent peptidase ImmA (M78 family)